MGTLNVATVNSGLEPSFSDREIDFERSNWDRARKKFIGNNKNTEQLRLFLKGRMYGSEVKQVCLKLQEESESKYQQGFGSILGNIDTLMNIGDLAIKSAPESVGLAWMGIRMCLHAVQGDWSTFQLFSGACADIIGIMISCRVYGKMYGEKSAENDVEDFHELHEKVVEYIPEIYTDILEFSFAVRKYTDKHIVIRIGKNIFKDTRSVFESAISKIKESDKTMREYAETASNRMMIHLQKKSLQSQNEMKSEILSLKGILETSFKANEAIVRRAFEEFEEERKKMKQKTPYEIAQDEFEDNMTYLNPTADQIGLLRENLDVKREPETCRWILEDDDYKKWHDSESSMIWISGAGGYGKSILMSTVIEVLRAETTTSQREVVQYFFCKAGTDATQATTQILKTIVAQLYTRSLALPDLLEQTNKVVSHAFSKRVDSNELDPTFDFVAVYSGLLRLMNFEVFMIIDAVDECIDRQSKQFLRNLRRIVNMSDTKVRIMVCSRPEADIGNELGDIANIKCEGRNTEDIRKNVATEMTKFPRWTATEKSEAVNQITHKSGGQFRYVQIALDFLRKPIVRPYSLVLERLPNSLTGSYQTSWDATDEDYVELLKTALTWTLFADGPVTVPEIMDAYTRAYSDDAGVKSELEDYEPASGEVDLHDRQVRIAGGNFLEVSSTRTVRLRHLTVRDFFVVQNDPSIAHQEENSAITGLQKSTPTNAPKKSQRSPWTISAKDGHLEMTRILVQNLSSSVFQEKYLSVHLPQEQVSSALATDPVPHTSKSSAGNDRDSLEKIFIEVEVEEEQYKAEEKHPQVSRSNAAAAVVEDDDIHQVVNQDYLFSDFDDDEALWHKDDGHLFHPLEETADDEQDANSRTQRIQRKHLQRRRYEITHWTHHLAKAQKLWSWDEQNSHPSWKAIWKHLTKFMCEDVSAFESWQDIVFEETEVTSQQKRSASSSTRGGYKGYGTPLQIASIFGLTSLATKLIEKGCKPTERKLFGWLKPLSQFTLEDLMLPELGIPALTRTPLDLALEMPNVNQDMVKIFVEQGCDVNDLASLTAPFENAIWHEPSYEFIKYFIDHGARANSNDDYQNYALRRFSQSGTDSRVLKLLLDAGGDLNEETEDSCPLHVLAARDDLPIELLRAYLEAGADVNMEDYNSERPLIGLVRRGNHEAVNLLLEFGADLHDKDKQRRTAMHWVARSGNTQTLELLLAKGAELNLPDKRERTPLFYACQYNNTEVAKQLLNRLVDQPGEEVNKKDFRRRTPLRQAAARGNIDLVKAILTIAESASAVNLQDYPLRQTTLHKAAHNGEMATLKILLDHGGDLSIPDYNGLTPFKLCMGAWINTRSKLKSKPLEDTLLFLVSQGEGLQSEDARGLLFKAVMKGSRRIVETILEAGFDADIKDKFGWTPLALAKEWRQNAIIDVLQSYSKKKSPSCWMKLDQDARLYISGGGLQARINQRPNSSSLTIVSDQPIPATNRKYYFEIEIELRALFEEASLVVGFTSLPTKLYNGELGRSSFGNKSCGWHGRHGILSGQETVPDEYATFGLGDIVGCAIDLGQQIVFYTKNGERLETAFTGVFGRLHPAITAMYGESGGNFPELTALVRANFGGDLKNRPFQWEGWKLWNAEK